MFMFTLFDADVMFLVI